jgi:hypothetical protein
MTDHLLTEEIKYALAKSVSKVGDFSLAQGVATRAKCLKT